MDKDTLLQLRRDAREEKRKLDQRRFDLHRQIVDLLFRGDTESLRVRAEALGQIAKWEQRHLCHPRYAHTWREWLSMPEEYARAAILREDDLGVAMRQNSPFDHAMARLANFVEGND